MARVPKVLSFRPGALLLAFLFVSLATTAGASPPAGGPAAEEYAVYRALLNHLYQNRPDVGLLVLADHTGCVLPGLTSPVQRDKMFDKAVTRLPRVDPRTLQDFRAKNQGKCPLAPRLELAKPYLLVSQTETEKLGLKKLREKYPASQGLLILSRVGFSPDGAQALVYFTNGVFSQSTGRPEAWGRLVLLQKNGDHWQVKKEATLWCT